MQKNIIKRNGLVALTRELLSEVHDSNYLQRCVYELNLENGDEESEDLKELVSQIKDVLKRWDDEDDEDDDDNDEQEEKIDEGNKS